MTKIALAVITRDTKDDAILLKRLLDNTKGHVDGLFITAASKTFDGHIKKLCKEYGAHYSEFEWINDFAAARNFNFSQVTEDYDYIMWSDIDDVWRDLDKLPEVLKKNVDAYAFWYMYHFDEEKQPTVVHKKTMIVKNDGTFIWKGAIHEDLDNDRQIDVAFIEDITRMHLTTEERLEEASVRNLEIAEKEINDDPRTHYNLGNAYCAVGEWQKAADVFERFIQDTGSHEEKYLIYQRLGWIHHHLGNREAAIKCFQIGIGMEPKIPDAYLELGKMFYENNDLDNAERYTLFGLVLKPQFRAVTVFNPRDYDYNPSNMLAKIYFAKGRPDKAIPCLKTCQTISPTDKTKNIIEEMEKEVKSLEEVTALIDKMKSMEPEDIKKALKKVPKKYKSHPGICMIRNQVEVKTESSGKDVTFYCGYTSHEWNPELFRTKGFGGSEEAVIHLSNQMAKKGMNVEVYANIGTEQIVENGVTWKPYWEFNTKNKTDHLILWRSTKMCDYELNAGKVYIDVHDVISPAEFTKDRLKKIDKVFVKTQIHKDLFPNIPEEKFAVIPNGIHVEDFEGEVEKEPLLIINTSSPDRSLPMFIKVAEQVKKKYPNAKFQWAYGWDLFISGYSSDKKMMEWMEGIEKERKRVGVEALGKIPQYDCNQLYKKADVFLYPSEFMEIDCISVKKAQLAGCKVVTTDFGALNESTIFGKKIHSAKNKDNWSKPYQYDFSADETLLQEFVDETIAAIESKTDNGELMYNTLKNKFNWEVISDKWINEM